jgi:hypothetical protein
MERERLRLDPRLAGLHALGVERVAQLLGDDDAPLERAQALVSRAGRERLRFPLPGTPERPGGGLSGRPEGAGTGWVLLERWRRAPLLTLLRSRLTAPRSASLAERRWNLLCHLRAHGVGTPEPLAVGARGNGLVSRDSFLVTREVEGFEPVPDWLAREERPDARRRGLRALGELFCKLKVAGVALPDLAPEHVLITAPAARGEGCGSAPAFGGLRRNRLPSTCLVDVTGGTIQAALPPDRLVRMLRGVDRPELALSAAERLRIVLVALRGVPRELWRSLLDAPSSNRPPAV